MEVASNMVNATSNSQKVTNILFSSGSLLILCLRGAIHLKCTPLNIALPLKSACGGFSHLPLVRCPLPHRCIAHFLEPDLVFVPAPEASSAVGFPSSGFAPLAFNGLCSFSFPASSFSSWGCVIFGLYAASFCDAEEASVPVFVPSLVSVFIFSRSS